MRPRNMKDGRKLSLYLPANLVDEIDLEAERLYRTRAEMVRMAWVISRRLAREAPVVATYPRELDAD